MTILELRILPPLAVARLGASDTPLASYRLDVDQNARLGYRTIVPDETLEVDIETGEIVKAFTPARIKFRDGDKIRPVAPFLEVFARTSPDVLEPLTLQLLAAHKLTPEDVKWTVHLGCRKIERRTMDKNDRIEALLNFSDYTRHSVLATCANFRDGKTLPIGWVQYVRPNNEFPEIRLRYTPPAGHVYGSSPTGELYDTSKPEPKHTDPNVPEERILYDPAKGGWLGYDESKADVSRVTNPGSIFTQYGPDGLSSGYFDDECDGIVLVTLDVEGKSLSAFARVGAGPPTFAPDVIPIRTIADELEQVAFGVGHDGMATLAEAEEILRRAVETVRLFNTTALNGNTVQGRTNQTSTMVRQDSNDFGRFFEPIMAPAIVDNHAILALHQNVLTALRSGTGAWFADALRKPEEIGDLSDIGRRKMPAMMRGADGRHLVLTRRQIDAVVSAAIGKLFSDEPEVKA
ncbi:MULTISPECIES: hypothetical protein [Rhizobium]|uniref:Phage tail protein n=1 Tax=Rhizobium aouanii TaxID=3118145 RepID=A0ABU8CJL4_9HYPH|nr:hypothetical protein [Rhizobium acaciae]MCW1410820.1 hypothetical protein [Rhizobium acaciae]MCW1742881.1 hypothetical protein [Rhizobium acaciae]MCW1750077.1 hypothetical protein [Rhizobium acaciae]